jgi:hypothetical protein
VDRESPVLTPSSNGRRRYYRRVIKIEALDSPNVQLGLNQIARGIEPTDETVVPGVIGYRLYEKRQRTWNKVRWTIGGLGEFYEGAELLMFPSAWLDLAEQYAARLAGTSRRGQWIGIDPAEGGDKTSMCAIDELGIVELVSYLTPNTAHIRKLALDFVRKHGVKPQNVCFDRGGGGKQHVDYIAADTGLRFRTVSFGESLVLDPKRGLRLIEEKIEHGEERYSYVNRRAQMYGELRLQLDPGSNPEGFAIPEGIMGMLSDEGTILRNQLEPIPLLYDGEGRMRLLKKDRKDPDSDEKTLRELIGHSPDEADALVLALHARLHRAKQAVAGSMSAYQG